VPIIFASSSMPMAELRAYAAQLEPVGGVIAFRGMPGGLRKVGRWPSSRRRCCASIPAAKARPASCARVQVIVDPWCFANMA
jgi:hypothetical protein